ncbi:hypothetical protein KAS79_03155 [Candidatus Parcubacteria bacterium]|nr:hypothetical protein [Candidatus Parcubacteria bacterium]
MIEEIYNVMGVILVGLAGATSWNLLDEKDTRWKIGRFFLTIIFVVVGCILFEMYYIPQGYGIPMSIEKIEVGGRYLLLSLTTEDNNQICRLSKAKEEEIKTYRIKKEKIPAGLSVGDILTKMKDGTLHIYEKATTNTSIQNARFILGFCFLYHLIYVKIKLSFLSF